MRSRWQLAAFATALLALYGLAAWFLILPDLRRPPSVDFAALPPSACRDPAFLHELQRERRILLVPLEQVSRPLVEAVLRQEDKGFFAHRGVDWLQMIKAAQKSLAAGEYRYGAGTITMQLVRELYLSKEKRALRKLREIAYALQAERRLSKREILELYLSVVHWGPGIYGVGAASCYYFAVSPAELDAKQSAQLVSVLPSPDRLGPPLYERVRPELAHD